MFNRTRCPRCAETIRREARQCRFCGLMLDGPAAGGGVTTVRPNTIGPLRRPVPDAPAPPRIDPMRPPIESLQREVSPPPPGVTTSAVHPDWPVPTPAIAAATARVVHTDDASRTAGAAPHGGPPAPPLPTGMHTAAQDQATISQPFFIAEPFFIAASHAGSPSPGAAPPISTRPVPVPPAVIAIVAVLGLVVLLAIIGALLSQPMPVTGPSEAATGAQPAAYQPADQPRLPPMPTGEAITWSGDTADDLIERQVGPMQMRITREGGSGGTLPRVEVRLGTATAVMVGEAVAQAHQHRIEVIQNRAGAPPVVLMQSLPVDTHSLVRVQLAGISGGTVKVVDLGARSEVALDRPRDLNGDGVTDFVFYDNAFSEAFASYGSDLSVPEIVNVTGGRVVDVSARPGFRSLFLTAIGDSEQACRAGSDGDTRNGACAAYLAAAARTGTLATAWAHMLSAYDASTGHVLPTGCRTQVAHGGACADADAIIYQSYPEALLAFLKREGYVARGWQPPEERAPPPDLPPPGEAADDPAA